MIGFWGSNRRILMLGVVAMIAAGFVLFLGTRHRASADATLKADTAAAADAVGDPAGDAVVMNGETYTQFEARRAATGSGESFAGYDCVKDCRQHRAGYDWAEAHRASADAQCRNQSWGFYEGCLAYLKAQQAEADETEREKSYAAIVSDDPRSN